MNRQDTYASMVGAAELAKPFSAPNTLGRFVSILNDADLKLRTQGAWRLDPEVAQTLNKGSSVKPSGGWGNFVSLLAGTPWGTANREFFEVDEVPDKDAPLRRQLIEAYTMRLVPPTAAASAFILLGIHPAWGVHLAHRMHKGVSSSKDRDTFPSETLEYVEMATFQFMSTVVGGLARLEADQAILTDDFERFVKAAIDHAGDRARRAAPDKVPGLAPFVDRMECDPNDIGSLLTQELLADVLVPAGAAEQRGDVFVVDGDLLGDIEVGLADKDYGGLASFLEAAPAA